MEDRRRRLGTFGAGISLQSSKSDSRSLWLYETPEYEILENSIEGASSKKGKTGEITNNVNLEIFVEEIKCLNKNRNKNSGNVNAE